METEIQMRELIDAHGLSHLKDELLARVRSTVFFSVAAAGQGECVSRIGGAPDLPEGTPWPVDEQGEALSFALQINLADIPQFDGNPFPEVGLMSVFVGLDEPATDIAHRIFLFSDLQKCKRRELPMETANETIGEILPHHLNVRVGPGLPRCATNEEVVLTEDLSEEDQGRYEQLVNALEPESVVRLLGHAAGIGHDPREDAYVVREVNAEWLYDYVQRSALDIGQADHWLHLLTINSDYDIDLGIWDAGYLQLLIKDTDLLALEFGRVYAAVESS